jgi:hypothetical protein
MWQSSCLLSSLPSFTIPNHVVKAANNVRELWMPVVVVPIVGDSPVKKKSLSISYNHPWWFVERLSLTLLLLPPTSSPLVPRQVRS